MMFEVKTSELELIANAFQAISKETSYEGLAKALLNAALGYSGAGRGAVLLSETGELLTKVDASFPREKASFFASQPPASEFRLPADLSEMVLTRRELVLKENDGQDSPLIGSAECRPGRIAQLCLPLLHRGQTVGLLYLESESKETFAPRYVSAISMLASQAAVSFESVQLFEALRETNLWMVKGQKIGRMGSYRWNTRTLLSRASRECYRIFDIDFHVNPVPFEIFKSRVHPDDFPALEEALADVVSTKSPFSHEYRVIHRDGTTLHVVAVGQFDIGPTGDVELDGIISDITDRKAAEQALMDARAELARAIRLASLGELAGSIVHEINQPLTGIIMSAEACLRWLEQSPAEGCEARKSALRVIEQGRRASDVVTGLKSLMRGAQLRLTDVQINDVVEEILLLLKRDLERTGVTLRTALDKSTPRIEGDRVQLEQVLLNLARNAIDAMRGVTGKPRILSLSTRFSDEGVAVVIADTGDGIAPASRDRLFDALYTTKSNGLGLGLSICRKIIAVHGGRLWVEENTPNGARFTFTLPLRQSAPMSTDQ